jgi:HEPN domain-containing protein/predicted nucleotidyltransferase
MKETIAHLPKGQQEEVTELVNIIKNNATVEMIILFGSFARGDWVSDKYKEGHITYEYQSDYDILVVVRNKQLENNKSLWNELDEKIKSSPIIKTPVSIVVDTIRFINTRLSEGNYFYSDIKNEGVLLYDSKAFTLVSPKTLPQSEKKILAERDYNFWFTKANSFLKDYDHNIADDELSNAAFHLHQVAEALYVAALLVFSGYKPKTHNLEKIESLVTAYIPTVMQVFPRNSLDEKKRFELLKKAYIEARYKQDYKVTKEELRYLRECVDALQKLIEKECKSKIAALK